MDPAAKALEEYARKREFDLTPEPGPIPAAPGSQRFCIQRHNARRLHYDLRIEVGGTLKSWAVPEGPTLDPSIKRLAVLVEDHPLQYATFEGNIPKGNYGAGSMMLWDIGTYDLLGDLPADAQLERGDFKIRLHGRKIAGEFAIVRIARSEKGNEWLLIKKKDAMAQSGWDIDRLEYSVRTGRTQQEIALDLEPTIPLIEEARLHELPATGAVRAPMPAFFQPMQATNAAAPPEGGDWTFELKWDGVRALCFLDHGKVTFIGRKGTNFDRQYPELAVVPEIFHAETAIIDGEIAALDEAGRPSFQRLQPRIMASSHAAVAQLARSRPVTFFAFDLLYAGGWDLREAPACERRKLLRELLAPHPNIRFSEDFPVEGEQLLELVRAQGLEGIVAKRIRSRYRSGRQTDWLKIKILHELDFVICGWAEGERDHFGSLVLGLYDNGRLEYAGNVGTGFDNKTLAAIRKQLDPLRNGICPFPDGEPAMLSPAIWVEPRLVCTCKFNSWTDDRHLRAPVFLGMRPDVDPEECVRTQAASGPAPPMLSADKIDLFVEVENHRIHFTNLNKIYYPALAAAAAGQSAPAASKQPHDYSKRDVLNYYDAVADLLLPHLRDRPLSLRRYPDGIEGEGFFQKNAAGMPDWFRTAPVVDVDGEEKLLAIGGGRAELLYLSQLGCIDQNPWMSRLASLDHPDFLLIDLDPSECEYARIVEAALLVRKKLDLLGLTGYPKTTGGDGMHIYVPLEPVYTYEQSRGFCEILARLCAAERPDLFTLPRHVARRDHGKVYFDYSQNARGKTISAPYVLRAYAGAPAATPLDWRELTPSLHPRQFHIANAPDRFARTGDLFAGVLTKPQRLEPAMERLESLIPGSPPRK
ncbi:MAG: DNA ligase D [Bryobacteraceae bacterium]